MARFSIILPVRNGGDYFKLCVQSVLQQSLPDFNLHVLENNSSDDTLQWITSLSDKRIIIHHSPTSLLIEENWSRVLSIPKNEFITLIGHDDILYSDYLETMDQLIKLHPGASSELNGCLTSFFQRAADEQPV